MRRMTECLSMPCYRLAELPDPVVDSDMAAFKETAYGAEPQALQIELKGLPPHLGSLPAMPDCVPVAAGLATVALPPHNPIFHTFFKAVLGTGNHESPPAYG